MCCTPGCTAFWTHPVTCMVLLILNIVGFLGWIAGAIYVTVEGQNNMMWMWAMPWQHLFQLGFMYKRWKAGRSGGQISNCA